MDVKLAIAQSLSGATGLPAEELAGYIETPPDLYGRLCLPCFRLAKAQKRRPPSPPSLREARAAPGIERAEAAGGYLNFFADKADLAGRSFRARSPRATRTAART